MNQGEDDDGDVREQMDVDGDGEGLLREPVKNVLAEFVR